MYPEESQPFRIGPATLVNATRYPSAVGEKIDRMLSHLDQQGIGTVRVMFGGAATFDTATLQPQLSFDGGTTWVNYGSALSAATPIIIEVPRAAKLGFLVGGTGNISAASLYLS